MISEAMQYFTRMNRLFIDRKSKSPDALREHPFIDSRSDGNDNDDEIEGYEEETTMKTKILSLLVTATLLLCLLSGCASDETAGASPQDDYAIAPDFSENKEVVSDADPGRGYVPEVNPDVPESSGKKIIYTASLAIEVENVKDAMEEISSAVSGLGGFVSGSDYQNRDRVSGTITVRIPPEKLGELSAKIGGLGKILSNNLSSQDITMQYVDISSRLANAEAQEEQLLDIMEKATEIADILAVRSELNIVQQEIEVYKGQLRYFDNMVDFSTVTVSLTEIYVPKSPEAEADKGILARWDLDYIGTNITKGFKNSLSFVVNAFGFILILLSYLLVPLLIIGAIVFVIVFIVKRIKKHSRKASKQAPPRGYNPPAMQSPSTGQTPPAGQVSPPVSAPPKKDGK